MQHRWALPLALAAAVATGPHAGARQSGLAPAPPETWPGAPGPAVGSVIPAFELPDQDGRPRTFASLKGPKGLVLNFNRSVIWCPYCKSQLVELGREAAAFRARGLEVAAIVPEPVADLKAFTTRLQIPIPILSDADGSVVRRFGLEDTRGNPYVPRAGLPYAGNLYLDAGGTVRERYFEQEVETRRTAGSILLQQGGDGTGRQQLALGHLVLDTSASNAELAPGQRFTVALDLALEEKHHVYAPGVTGYRPLKLVLDANPLFEAHPTQFPPARTYYYAPLRETVPVFEGHVRVLQDLTLAFRPALAAMGKEGEHDVALTGTLEYQVCSDRVCYPPSAAPVRWTFRLKRWTK